jgi:hypothetical protein
VIRAEIGDDDKMQNRPVAARPLLEIERGDSECRVDQRKTFARQSRDANVDVLA